MNLEQTKYIIPPRLKRRQTFFGFHPEELIVITLLFFIGFLQRVYNSTGFILSASALLAGLFFRGAGEKNAYTYLKLLYRFYFRPQIFTLKECDKHNENK